MLGVKDEHDINTSLFRNNEYGSYGSCQPSTSTADSTDSSSSTDKVIESHLSDQNTRMAATIRKVERSNEKLQRSIQLLNDTCDVGAQTLVELKRQKEQIEKSRDRLNDVDKNIGHSDKILKKMSRSWFDPRYWFNY